METRLWDGCGKTINKNNNRKQHILGKGEILISRVSTLLELNVQFLIKKFRHSKKLESMTHSKEKYQQKYLKKELLADLLDKDVKTTV